MTASRMPHDDRFQPLGDQRMTEPVRRPGKPRGLARSSAPLDFEVRAVLYLVALALAEVTTVLIDTRWGVVGHAVLLTMLVVQASLEIYRTDADQGSVERSISRKQANFLAALALMPLIRIISLAIPLSKFPEWSWYGLIAIPLLAATFAAARAAGYSRKELGFRVDWRPGPLALTTLVAVSGVGLGYLEYRILEPDAILDTITPAMFIVSSLLLLIGTGLAEEFIFRGVLQVASTDVLGQFGGIVYSSTLFAILHIGHRSAMDVVFVFVVALSFGTIVRRTGSLAGVTIAHGLTNICLFVIFPHFLGTA